MAKLKQTGQKCVLTDFNPSGTLQRGIFNETNIREHGLSASACGAHYIAACSAETESSFINHIKMMVENWSQTVQFLTLLGDLNPDFAVEIENIRDEGNNLILDVNDSLHLLRQG